MAYWWIRRQNSFATSKVLRNYLDNQNRKMPAILTVKL